MNIMTASQSVLIVGSEPSNINEVIKSILQVEDLPPSVEIEDGISSYPWHIDTKYYSASVNVCSTNVKSLSSETFANTVEAIIIYFDSSVTDGLENVNSWLSFLKEYEPEVKILLCDHCDSETSTGVSKLIAQEWCIGKGFELVELSPEEDEEDEDSDFAESTGVKRIVQALQAHVWPNLTMKPECAWSGSRHYPVSDELASDLQSLSVDAPFESAGTEIEDKIDELFCEGSSELEFSELFSELQNMKERVSNLPPEERKACAEKVVLAFWKAIGGDDDEVNCDNEDR